MSAETVFHKRGTFAPRMLAPGSARSSSRLKIVAPHSTQQMLTARNLFLAHFQRGHHRRDDGDVFRSGAPAALLFAAEEQRRDWTAVRDFQKTHAARPAEFMRRAADVITFAESLAGHLADELHGVGEKQHFVGLADGTNFPPRLDDAGLVVCGHHGRPGRGARPPVPRSASPGPPRRRA